MHLLGPLDSIGLTITGEAGQLFLTLLRLRITPYPRLAYRQLGGLVKEDPHHAILGVRDIHRIHGLIFDYIGTAVFKDETGLVEPLAQDVENIIERRVAITLDPIRLESFGTAKRNFPGTLLTK